MKDLQATKLFFDTAVPNPDVEKACIQIGCHMEEFVEMLDALGLKTFGARREVEHLSKVFKSCERQAVMLVRTLDKDAMLDAVIDQTVTAYGISHMLGFDHIGALGEVNRSNLSKFEDGKAVFKNGKIAKGVNYTPPVLGPYLGE